MTLQMLQLHQLNRDLGFYKTEIHVYFVHFLFCNTGFYFVDLVCVFNLAILWLEDLC